MQGAFFVKVLIQQEKFINLLIFLQYYIMYSSAKGVLTKVLKIRPCLWELFYINLYGLATVVLLPTYQYKGLFEFRLVTLSVKSLKHLFDVAFVHLIFVIQFNVKDEAYSCKISQVENQLLSH